MDYETINTELKELARRLRHADDTTISAHRERLRRSAAGIADGTWRRRALQRIDKLPDLVAGAQPGRSLQYSAALVLVSRAHGVTGPAAVRIAAAERAASRIAELAAEAPPEEGPAIKRMNGSLVRLIGALRRGRA